MNKKGILVGFVLIITGLLLMYSPISGGYAAAAGLGLLIGGVIGILVGFVAKRKSN